MTNDEAAWEVQYLINRKAELDQGREALARAGVLYFDSDGISHGIDQLIEQLAKLRSAGELAFAELEEQMDPMDYDEGPPESICAAYDALFKALGKAPAPETDDDGSDLPL